MRKSNIVLIGMPGAGKSTVGVLLAKALNMFFLDTDLVIQQKENRFLQDIINSDGLERFLHIEEAAVLSLEVQNHIIATGGSVVYSSAAVQHLKKDGFLVYLQLQYNEIEKRIKNISSRGIAMGHGQSLYSLYAERIPLYEEYSDIAVNCSGKDIEKVVNEIIDAMKTF